MKSQVVEVRSLMAVIISGYLGQKYCDYTSLLVELGSLRSFLFLENYKSDFHAISLRCSASVPNLITNFSEVNVKSQA